MSILNWLVVFLLVANSTPIPIACVGFVENLPKNEFSNITIKLLTPERYMRYEVDVDSSTELFVMPVYRIGNYSLKVSSPSGYYFEPETYDLNIDGATDPCTLDKKINFKFAGFSIRGIVDGADAGLNLVLKSSSGQQIDSAVTTEGGKYEMKAPSGKYEVLIGAGASECISRGKASVEVAGSPVEVKPNLKISGYQLNIDTNKFTGATINIFSQNKIDLPNIKCSQSQSKDIPSSHQFKCELGKTNSAGKLAVSCVPSANYYITASYDNIAFSPSSQQVTVSQSSSDAKFVAESATSKVRVTANGKPYSGIDVILNGKVIGKSDSNGFVTLEGLKEGSTQTVTAKAEHVHFTTSKIAVKFPTVTVEDIKVAQFDICGTVESLENENIENSKLYRKIKIRPKDGSFCQSVAPGIYTIESSSLTPKSIQIDVTSKPVTDLRFTHSEKSLSLQITPY